MRFYHLLWVALCVGNSACGDNPSVLAPDAGDTDSDTDSDSDTDTDSDTDSDTDTDTETETETETEVCSEVEWVPISGGTFLMGGPEDTLYTNQLPIHEVTVPSFEITRTEVTAAQYRCCYLEGSCTEPQPPGYTPDTDDPSASLENCNWDLQEEDNRPINCVNWQQAVDFCAWAGGRLPSEAEWEYAARNQGQDVTYPWGEEEPSCDLCIMNEAMGMPGCDEERTWDVCSKPAGNTGQGLCDMAGNVHEWIQDCYHTTYEGAPDDGSAWQTECDSESGIVVLRSGSYFNGMSNYFCTSSRSGGYGTDWSISVGYRCVR